VRKNPIIIGVDETGRGALAGPLVVCAAAFHPDTAPVTATYRGLRRDKELLVSDSKSYSNPKHREVLDREIRKSVASIAVVERSAKQIDAHLMFVVYPATLRLAIARVMEQLVHQGYSDRANDYVVKLDGDIRCPGVPCPVHSIPGGDKTVWQISAASVVAKVYRDKRMREMHDLYPEWDFDKHKGYPTPKHKELLEAFDATPIHRRTFRPVAEAQGMPPGFEV